MKKYQKGFIGWMIPALYVILAMVGGSYMLINGSIAEKFIGAGLLVISVITAWKAKKHLPFNQNKSQEAP